MRLPAPTATSRRTLECAWCGWPLNSAFGLYRCGAGSLWRVAYTVASCMSVMCATSPTCRWMDSRPVREFSVERWATTTTTTGATMLCSSPAFGVVDKSLAVRFLFRFVVALLATSWGSLHRVPLAPRSRITRQTNKCAHTLSSLVTITPSYPCTLPLRTRLICTSLSMGRPQHPTAPYCGVCSYPV